jgi:hypothetical protein
LEKHLLQHERKLWIRIRQLKVQPTERGKRGKRETTTINVEIAKHHTDN